MPRLPRVIPRRIGADAPVHSKSANTDIDQGERSAKRLEPRAVLGSLMARSNRYPYRADIHSRLIEAAAAGRPITYSALGTSRAWVGTYLFRIAHEEDAAGRPPLTAIVVHKTDGRPGPGLRQALDEIGYARPGETDDTLWRRAEAHAFEYWRTKSAKEFLATWRPTLSDDRDTWPRFR